MKYNVGDKVIVKKDLKEGKVYNRIQFVGGMSKFKGKRLEIVNKNKRRYKTVYNLKGANFGFNDSIYY